MIEFILQGNSKPSKESKAEEKLSSWLSVILKMEVGLWC